MYNEDQTPHEEQTSGEIAIARMVIGNESRGLVFSPVEFALAILTLSPAQIERPEKVQNERLAHYLRLHYRYSIFGS